MHSGNIADCTCGMSLQSNSVAQVCASGVDMVVILHQKARENTTDLLCLIPNYVGGPQKYRCGYKKMDI